MDKVEDAVEECTQTHTLRSEAKAPEMEMSLLPIAFFITMLTASSMLANLTWQWEKAEGNEEMQGDARETDTH